MEDFKKNLALSFAQMLKPLITAFRNKDEFIYFFRSMGWLIDDDDVDIQKVREAFDFFYELQQISDIIQKIASDSDNSKNELYINLLNAITGIVPKIKDVRQYLDKTKLPKPFQNEANLAVLQNQLINALLARYFRDYRPFLYGTLSLMGIIKTQSIENADQNNSSVLNEYSTIEWSAVEELILTPESSLKNTYAYGDVNNAFKWSGLFDNIQYILLSLGIPATIFQPPKNLRSKYYSKGVADNYKLKALRIPIYAAYNQSIKAFAEISFFLIPVPPSGVKDHAPEGFLISLYMNGMAGGNIPLSNGWSIIFRAGASSGIGCEFLPDNTKVVNNLFSDNDSSIAEVNFSVALNKNEGSKKTILLGTSESTHLELRGFQLRLDANGDLSGDYNIGLEMALLKAAVVIKASDGDSFLNIILPKEPIEILFDISAGVSRKNGLYIQGGAGLNYTSHINKSFGPIYINTVELNLDAGDKGITLITAASGGAKIGPVTASVEKIGLETLLDFTKPGLLGNADFSLDFKPPSAIGIVIDAAGVKGGGFLEMEGGNYTGVLELSIKNKVSLTVIGILTTKMPDGSKTFSLKLFGFAEFTPVQLGLGFVISGVGLAAAIECCMNEEALRDAVYNGSLRSILFPPDPIQNARQIINDLEAFFPSRNNCYVFGAMVKLGWGGAKPLVKAEVGIFLETGEVIRIALAGMAYAKLPNEDSPVLILQLQVLGILDFTNKTLAIDSSLKGSKLLNWTLDGDIALRSGWGDNPCFALSCGGFYPGYRAPAGFPSLRRLSITLGSGNPRIGLFLYLATTENSVQCGAMLLFYFSKKIKIIGLIELEGGLAFDALFRFNPFYFETRLAAWLDLKRNGKSIMGIDLRLNLTGPNIYRAWGYGKVKIIGIGVEVEFDKTFGTKKPELPQETISPLGILTKELAEAKNWSITMPLWGGEGVLFREGSDTDNYIDPYGGIYFRQNSIPLCLKLQKYRRAAILAGEDYFDIVAQNGSEASDAEDFFAPGEFRNLSDQEKLSAPAFEKMKSGIQLSGNHIETETDSIRHKEMEYETKELDNEKEIKEIPGVAGKLKSSALLGAQKLFAGKIKAKTGVASAGIKGVSVNEQKFTIVTPNGRGDKFERAGIRKNGKTTSAGNLTFAQTLQEKEKMGIKDTEVVDSIKAVAVASF